MLKNLSILLSSFLLFCLPHVQGAQASSEEQDTPLSEEVENFLARTNDLLSNRFNEDIAGKIRIKIKEFIGEEEYDMDSIVDDLGDLNDSMILDDAMEEISDSLLESAGITQTMPEEKKNSIRDKFRTDIGTLLRSAAGLEETAPQPESNFQEEEKEQETAPLTKKKFFAKLQDLLLDKEEFNPLASEIKGVIKKFIEEQNFELDSIEDDLGDLNDSMILDDAMEEISDSLLESAGITQTMPEEKKNSIRDKFRTNLGTLLRSAAGLEETAPQPGNNFQEEEKEEEKEQETAPLTKEKFFAKLQDLLLDKEEFNPLASEIKGVIKKFIEEQNFELGSIEDDLGDITQSSILDHIMDNPPGSLLSKDAPEDQKGRVEDQIWDALQRAIGKKKLPFDLRKLDVEVTERDIKDTENYIKKYIGTDFFHAAYLYPAERESKAVMHLLTIARKNKIPLIDYIIRLYSQDVMAEIIPRGQNSHHFCKWLKHKDCSLKPLITRYSYLKDVIALALPALLKNRCGMMTNPVNNSLKSGWVIFDDARRLQKYMQQMSDFVKENSESLHNALLNLSILNTILARETAKAPFVFDEKSLCSASLWSVRDQEDIDEYLKKGYIPDKHYVIRHLRNRTKFKEMLEEMMEILKSNNGGSLERRRITVIVDRSNKKIQKKWKDLPKLYGDMDYHHIDKIYMVLLPETRDKNGKPMCPCGAKLERMKELKGNTMHCFRCKKEIKKEWGWTWACSNQNCKFARFCSKNCVNDRPKTFSRLPSGIPNHLDMLQVNNTNLLLQKFGSSEKESIKPIDVASFVLSFFVGAEISPFLYANSQMTYYSPEVQWPALLVNQPNGQPQKLDNLGLVEDQNYSEFKRQLAQLPYPGHIGPSQSCPRCPSQIK